MSTIDPTYLKAVGARVRTVFAENRFQTTALELLMFDSIDVTGEAESALSFFDTQMLSHNYTQLQVFMLLYSPWDRIALVPKTGSLDASSIRINTTKLVDLLTSERNLTIVKGVNTTIERRLDLRQYQDILNHHVRVSELSEGSFMREVVDRSDSTHPFAVTDLSLFTRPRLTGILPSALVTLCSVMIGSKLMDSLKTDDDFLNRHELQAVTLPQLSSDSALYKTNRRFDAVYTREAPQHNAVASTHTTTLVPELLYDYF